MSLVSQISAVISRIATEVKGKQNTLVSGTNLKTINGASLLGSGDLTVAGSGGSANKLVAEIDFGVSANGVASLTVSAAWANSTSGIICAPLATATDDHDPDDYALEGIRAYAANIVDGVGFDIIASCNNTTFGKYNIQAIGV